MVRAASGSHSNMNGYKSQQASLKFTDIEQKVTVMIELVIVVM